MILAYDAKRYFNNSTGLGFYSRTLLDNLRQFYPEHTYLLYTPYNKGKFGHIDDTARLPHSVVGKLLHPVWRNRGIVQQAQLDGARVFHGLSHELPAGLKKAGIGGVVTMHDLIFIRYPEYYPAIDRFFYRQKYRSAALQADQVVAISEQTKADLVEFFHLKPDRIEVIGQACDHTFERLSLRHQPDTLAMPLPAGLEHLPALDFALAVGGLTPRKNWLRLLEALDIARQQGREIPLVAVATGKSTYAQQVKAWAAQKQLPVYWIEKHLTVTDLALLYRRAACLVYPSLFEGFGLPVLEGITVGIPVVTSTGSCFAETGGGAALYADPGQADQLADRMIQVTTPSVCARLASQRPVQLARFDPKKLCERWMQVYANV